MVLLGVDTGGTFTDFVVNDGDKLRIHKVLSTPDAPERAILQGGRELGLDTLEPGLLHVVHGSTVATNAVLEGKGVRTAYITNHGLADILTIGRQARAELYDLQPPPVEPPVPAELCLETGGRLDHRGEVVEPLSEEQLRELVAKVAELAPQAVAINLLFSFIDDRFEQQIEQALPDDIFISRSSRVLPEYKEYERGMATWLNAYVGPLVEGYLARLQQGLPEASLAVMQSSGRTIDAALAGAQAVQMLLSGPAGGLAAARRIGRMAGRERLLTFDMGGTSTDVALIDGELQLTSEGRIGDYPVAVPQVDMHTIGAGGGSIAYVDAGGMLQVGPESAGAAPGPACYGNGGKRPTVTDANLILGRLRPDAFLGGGMSLDIQAAHSAMATVAEPLGLTLEEAAQGVIRVANEHMARALRVMSVQRGIDPRELTLVSFGGAGGLHVCDLAEAMGMHHALVPIHSGVLSALGMLVAPKGRELSRTVQGLLQEFSDKELGQRFGELEAEGIAALEREGLDAEEITVKRQADLRYRGQSYTLTVPWQGAVEAGEHFHHAHQSRYGHRMERSVELVNLRVSLKGPEPQLELMQPQGKTAQPNEVALYGLEQMASIYPRDSLAEGQRLRGPALVTEQVATSYIAPGWEAMVDPHGNLVLDKLI